jgi:hypothetical protein
MAALCASIGVGAFGLAGPASADMIYVLDQSGCCGNIDFGTVTLHDVAPGIVDVKVHLIEPDPVLGIVNTGLTSFLFNNSVALDETDVTFVNPITGFTWATDLKGDGAGTFQYGFDCGAPACGNGGSDPWAGDLEFIIAAPGLSSATFTANAVQLDQDGNPVKGGNFFAVDICFDADPNGSNCSGGATGLVWTNHPCTEGANCLPPPCTDCCQRDCGDQNVPEPGPLALLAAAGFALVANRRRPLQQN